MKTFSIENTFTPRQRNHRILNFSYAVLTLKAFFGEKHLRDIKPMMIETFKRERLATPTKHDKEDRPRPRIPASVNRDLASLKDPLDSF